MPKSAPDTIPLDAIAPGAAVRVTAIGGVQYLAANDLIAHVCATDAAGAEEAWQGLPNGARDDLGARSVRFGGPGQTPQPGLPFPGALKLLEALPGDAGRRHRDAFSRVLGAHYALARPGPAII